MKSNCWAWSTVASLEGAIWKQTGKKVKLSVQQLTDCITSNTEFHSKCSCGNMDNGNLIKLNFFCFIFIIKFF